jgi:hypothetical protein
VIRISMLNIPLTANVLCESIVLVRFCVYNSRLARIIVLVLVRFCVYNSRLEFFLARIIVLVEF